MRVPLQINNSQVINTKRLDFRVCLFVFLESCSLERDRSDWLCGKLCEGMVQVCVPVHMQAHWRGERGNLINEFLPALGGGALPVNPRTHTVMVWESLVYAVPLALPSSERLVWKTRTHPPLPPQPLAPRLASVCGGDHPPAAWLPGGPGGSQATG